MSISRILYRMLGMADIEVAPLISPDTTQSIKEKQTKLAPEMCNIVIGLGPAGLAAALEVCKKDSKKRKVIAITDRTSYTRQGIFRLDVDIFPYLEELVGSEKIQQYFQQGLIGSKESLNGWDFHIIQIKTLEDLLYETLCKQDNVEIICLPKHKDLGKITAIDKENHILTLAQENDSVTIERVIPFKYLIAADGPTHGIANLIAKDEIIYDQTQHEQIYNRHARATYKLPEHICADKFRSLLQPVNSQPADISSLKNLSWELHSSPEVRVFVVDGYLFIATECPHNLSKNDSEAIDRWIRAELALLCPQSVVDELKNVDTAIFDVSLEEANRTFIPLPPSHLRKDKLTDDEKLHDEMHYFFQLGDCLRKTHYQTGSGAVVSLREAKAFGIYLQSSQSLSDLERYHSEIAHIRTMNRERVDTFIDKRKEREMQVAKSLVAIKPGPTVTLLSKSMGDMLKADVVKLEELSLNEDSNLFAPKNSKSNKG